MNRNLFLVDDNVDHHFIIYSLLKQLDRPYNVKFFENGKALWHCITELLRTGQTGSLPGLIVLDLNMPGMNGLHLLKLFKQPGQPYYDEIKNIPVIIMSSAITENQIKQCYHAGANAVIIKPFEFNQMKNTLYSIGRFWLEQQHDESF